MTTALTGALELLDRSLGYTREALAGVRPGHLDLPTPCRAWSLGQLLEHMEDGLDAFTEAAGGRISTAAPDRARPPAERLEVKACHLLRTWSRGAPVGVCVDGAELPTDLLVSTAALEITVHGWDVACSLGVGHPVPEAFAARLLDVAALLVSAEDRGIRFDPPVVPPAGASYADRLLGHLGRTGMPRARADLTGLGQ